MHAGTRRGSLPAVALALAMLLAGCGGEGGTPAAPTPPQAGTPPPATKPAQTVDLSPYVGVWDLTWRQTTLEDSGHGGCVAETMRSRTGVPVTIVLTVTSGSGMTITSPWGDHACTFRDFKPYDNGFAVGGGGFITIDCEPSTLSFKCSDGTRQNNLYNWTSDLNGRLTGNELAGEFSSVWAVAGNDSFLVGSYGEYTGTRR